MKFVTVRTNNIKIGNRSIKDDADQIPMEPFLMYIMLYIFNLKLLIKITEILFIPTAKFVGALFFKLASE